MNDRVKKYLRHVAAEFIEDDSEEDRDAMWALLPQEDRDLANELVEGIFGEWL